MCSGLQVTDEAIKRVGARITEKAYMGNFRTLTISSTSITKLEKNTFANLFFENIIIEINNQLISIDGEAFSKHPVKRLFIKYNPKLEDTKIFDLVNHLQVYDTIELDGNAFKEIPSNAFKSDDTQYSPQNIYLSNNKIEKIGTNAFSSLPSLIHLSLDNNLISHIEDNAINLNQNQNKNLFIELKNNSLTAKSLTKNSIIIPSDSTATLGLEYNQLTDLPEVAFKPFADHYGNKILLFGNKFNCDCNMEWVYKHQYKEDLREIFCTNKNEYFNDLRETDFSSCNAF